MNKTIILFNPSAGKGRAGQNRAELEERLSSFDIPYELIVTQSEDHLKALTAENASRCSVLAGAGGDSTFNIMINVLMRHGFSTPLAMFGMGSSNDVPKAFGLETMDSACRALKRGHAHSIDLGAAANETGILKYFIGQGSIGLGPMVAAYVEELSVRKPKWGRHQTLAGILAVMAAYRGGEIPLPLEIQIPGTREGGRYLTAVFHNTRYWATGKILNPESRPDDGRLDCCLIRECSLIRLSRLYGLAGKGLLGNAREVTFLQANTFQVSSSHAFEVQVDGELLGGFSRPARFNRIEFRLVPGSLPLIF